MESIFDHEGDKDLAKHRIVELDNNNKIHIKREDPYGFWFVNLERGRFPDGSILHGAFTSFDRAMVAVETYLHERRRAMTEVKQTVGETKTKAA